MSSTTSRATTDETPRAATRGVSPHPLDVRPCGKCAALVPADTGCRHWKPDATTIKGRSAQYWERKKVRDAERRARSRAVERAARQRAAEAVAEFRRQQGI